MRFDRKVRSNPYLNRRDQFRLLRLVALLTMVAFAIPLAARPSSWNWFFAVSGVEVEQPEGSPASLPENLKPFDIRRPGEERPLAEDEIYARVAEQPEQASDSESSVLSSPETASDDRLLSANVLDGVEDDWFGLTRAEQPALARIADRLDTSSPAALTAQADHDVTFDALLGNPDYFRGRLVTISGRLRRCTQTRIGVGDDAREIWEAWVVMSDSQNTPCLVYCLDAPTGMPTGETLDEAATVTGYFVRRYAYASVGGEAITAMLIAPALDWRPAPPPVTPRLKQEMQWGALVWVSIVVCVLLAVGGWYFLSDRRFKQSRLNAIGESRLDAAPEDLTALAQLDGGDPHEIRVDDEAEQTAPA